MKKILATVSGAAFLGLSALVGITPAMAAGPMHGRYQQQDNYVANYCNNNPRAEQCDDWRSNRSNWGNSQYQGFYRTHRNDNGFGSNVAAALFGFAAGAAMTGQSGHTSDHVRACENRYRSYSARTDTFLGNDGARHACRL